MCFEILQTIFLHLISSVIYDVEIFCCSIILSQISLTLREWYSHFNISRYLKCQSFRALLTTNPSLQYYLLKKGKDCKDFTCCFPRYTGVRKLLIAQSMHGKVKTRKVSDVGIQEKSQPIIKYTFL